VRDLEILHWLVGSAERFFPAPEGYDLDGLVTEFDDILRDELDYMREARNVGSKTSPADRASPYRRSRRVTSQTTALTAPGIVERTANVAAVEWLNEATRFPKSSAGFASTSRLRYAHR
jgi:predicted unusual protein kinase regulating ubiquinone biosynthesis (AarF/ABC1/UbiB family)